MKSQIIVFAVKPCKNSLIYRGRDPLFFSHKELGGTLPLLKS